MPARSGFFKIYVDAEDGKRSVRGFPMAGDLNGMDGIASEVHAPSIVALDYGELCVLPYRNLLERASRLPPIQHQIHRMMSRELMCQNELRTLLGSRRADARLAEFLLSLSRRFSERGYSGPSFAFACRVKK